MTVSELIEILKQHNQDDTVITISTCECCTSEEPLTEEDVREQTDYWRDGEQIRVVSIRGDVPAWDIRRTDNEANKDAKSS